MKEKIKLRPSVILIPGIIFIAMVVIGFGNPTAFINALNAFYVQMMYNLGWIDSLLLLALSFF